MKDLLKKFENKEPVIVFNWKMPKQKLKAGLLSTLFVVVLPEVERMRKDWTSMKFSWQNNGGEIRFLASYWRCKIRN
jgi:hypothetical protein